MPAAGSGRDCHQDAKGKLTLVHLLCSGDSFLQNSEEAFPTAWPMRSRNESCCPFLGRGSQALERRRGHAPWATPLRAVPSGCSVRRMVRGQSSEPWV